jgi:phosphoribosylanthranilate isomerase
MKIKICGITNADDAILAAELGADALGFILHPKSPRYVAVPSVEKIVGQLPPYVQTVGVFVDAEAEFIDEAVARCRLDLLQLHGAESPEFCASRSRRVVKAFRVAQRSDIEAIAKYKSNVCAALLDTKVADIEGGTGKTFDWSIAVEAKKFGLPIVLAGGINAGNIARAVETVGPYAVDVSSGVEAAPGKKDAEKLKALIRLAKSLGN